MTQPQQNRIWRELTQIFREVFDDETLVIGSGTTARDIPDWDSQAHINLIVAAEEHFDVRSRTAAIAALKDVGDFVRLIEVKLVSA